MDTPKQAEVGEVGDPMPPLSTDSLIPSIVLGLISAVSIFGTYSVSFFGAALVTAALFASIVQYFMNTKIYNKIIDNQVLGRNVLVGVLATVLLYPIQFVSSFSTAKFLCADSYMSTKSLSRLAMYGLIPFATYVILIVSQIMAIGLAPSNLLLIQNLTDIYFVFCVIALASAFAMWAYFDNRPCHVESVSQPDLVKYYFTERFGDKEANITIYEKNI
jgi:hypothetical protein